jgi:hypothetical protein
MHGDCVNATFRTKPALLVGGQVRPTCFILTTEHMADFAWQSFVHVIWFARTGMANLVVQYQELAVFARNVIFYHEYVGS